MQALLHAVGLGDGAIPMAAALNWVIKDGVGQLGGVLFASVVSDRFDADPRYWRFVSSLALDASTLLELLSPLAPGCFLPIASVANVGKNVSFLSASASRAALHLALAREGNLADVTAKTGSQARGAARGAGARRRREARFSRARARSLVRADPRRRAQTIVGSLVGTTLGIALSTQLGDAWGAPLVAGFVSLSAV